MINRFINPKCKIETRILQKLLVLSIFFLIYISNIFLKIEKKVQDITYLTFLNNFGFFVVDKFMLKIEKLLEKIRKITFDWGIRNAIIYDISKIKAILFFKAWNQKLVKQLMDTQLKFKDQII